MNRAGIWQAAYTAGVVLPKPVATATYYHRALQPKKLVAVNFTRLAVRGCPPRPFTASGALLSFVAPVSQLTTGNCARCPLCQFGAVGVLLSLLLRTF